MSPSDALEVIAEVRSVFPNRIKEEQAASWARQLEPIVTELGDALEQVRRLARRLPARDFDLAALCAALHIAPTRSTPGRAPEAKPSAEDRRRNKLAARCVYADVKLSIRGGSGVPSDDWCLNAFRSYRSLDPKQLTEAATQKSAQIGEPIGTGLFDSMIGGGR